MSTEHATIREEAARSIGQPVCVLLRDGSYYIGWITQVDNTELTLSGHKGAGKLSKANLRHAEKAKSSGFLPSTPGFGGGQGGFPFGFSQPGAGFPSFGNAPAASGGGIFGRLGGLGAGMRFGWGMLKFIMPLLGAFKI